MSSAANGAGNVTQGSADYYEWNIVDSTALQSDDTSYCYCIHDGTNDYANLLTVNTFGFAIPSTAVINGVEVSLLHSEDYDGEIESVGIALLNVSSVGSKFISTVPNSIGISTLGSSTDTWFSGSLTPTNVNNSAFGCSVNALLAVEPTPGDYVNGYYSIDKVTITIYYTVAGQALRVSRVPLNSFVQGALVP